MKNIQGTAGGAVAEEHQPPPARDSLTPEKIGEVEELKLFNNTRFII